MYYCGSSFLEKMPRKLTALTFLAVMTLLITLKHPVLGYCFCLESYFTSDCVCQLEKNATAEPEKSDVSSDQTCSDCCASCDAKTSDDTPDKPSPCDDCTESLSIDVGSFVWDGSHEIPSDTESLLPVPVYALDIIGIPAASAHSEIAARGDPPPILSSGSIPLYLRHAVLRL